MSELIEISSITIDPNLQTRFSLNASAVADYQAAIEAAQPMPGVTIFYDGKRSYLADGFHRLQAYKQAGRDHIPANIHQGSQRDAFIYAISANATHGLRRSPEDKRRAVQMALDDLELNELSDRELAKVCGVSHTYVANVRRSIKEQSSRQPLLSKKPAISFEHKVATLPPIEVIEEPNQQMTQEEFDQIEERDALAEQLDEIKQLKDRLAIAGFDATPEEKELAATTIAELRKENKMLQIELNAVKSSCNTLMTQNSELVRECKKQMYVIKKLNAQLNASAEIIA